MKNRSLLLGVLILLWAILAMTFPAFAQYNLTLVAKDAGGNVKTQFAKGEDLFLNINLDNAGSVAGCAFTLNFPAAVLQPPATNADGLAVNSGDITSAFPFMQSTTPTHRENSSDPGKIYFAGAEIAAALTAFVRAHDAAAVCGTDEHPAVLAALAQHVGDTVCHVSAHQLDRVGVHGGYGLARLEIGVDAHQRALLAGLALAAGAGAC